MMGTPRTELDTRDSPSLPFHWLNDQVEHAPSFDVEPGVVEEDVLHVLLVQNAVDLSSWALQRC